MSTPKQITLAALLALGASGLPAGAQQATSPGTQISNTATASYIPPGKTTPITPNSNTVITETPGGCPITIVPTDINRDAFAIGENISTVLTYAVTSKDAGTFVVATALQGNGGLTPSITTFIDANGNGTLDAGEEVPQGGLVFTADETKAVSLLVTAPASDANARDTANIALTVGCAANSAAIIRVAAPTTPPKPEPQAGISVDKTFEPSVLRPKQITKVTIVSSNRGEVALPDAVLSDNFADLRRRGLVFVSGSARTTRGNIEYYDGTNWTSSEPADVHGIRVKAGSLAVGADFTLTFDMRADGAENGATFMNVATFVAGDEREQDTAVVRVTYLVDVAIGPDGDPEAPEGTPQDGQTKPYDPESAQPVCFVHTVRNTGDDADDFSITVTFPEGSASFNLAGPDGGPLAQPIRLEPGEEYQVTACYTDVSGITKAKITVTGAKGSSNATTDILRPYPKLAKAVSSIQPIDGREVKANMVKAGDLVTYTLSVTNTYGLDLTNALVTDPLPAGTEYVSATPSPDTVTGAVGSQILTWNYPTFAKDSTKNYQVTVRVLDDVKMGQTISNVLKLTADEVSAESPEANVYIPIKIKVEKDADVQVAAVGDRVTFTLTITNPSPVAALEPVNVIDVLADPAALGYISGTATIIYSDSKETVPIEPNIATETLEKPIGNHAAGATVEEVMRWQLPKLEPGQSATITYEMRVEPGAADSEELENFVLAEGQGPGGEADIAQDDAAEVIRRTLERFKPVGDILGLVYVDRNRDGTYDKGFDTPVNRARVVLAGGRISVTDKDGRYNFMNVPLGSHAVRLDPGTVPYPPLVKPQEGGLIGTQLVHVRGLDHVDFPLAPLAGDIDVIRRTTLNAGPLTVTKIVYVTGDSYTVNLYLDSTSAVDIALSDPLPEGATLREGTAGFTGSVQQPRVVSYSFSFDGEPREAVTDPELEWR